MPLTVLRIGAAMQNNHKRHRPPVLPPTGHITLLEAVALTAATLGTDTAAGFVDGTTPAEGRLRQLLRDGRVPAILQLFETGQVLPMPAEEWSGPRAPMFFEDGTVFIPVPETDFMQGYWAAIHVNVAELTAVLSQMINLNAAPAGSREDVSHDVGPAASNLSARTTRVRSRNDGADAKSAADLRSIAVLCVKLKASGALPIEKKAAARKIKDELGDEIAWSVETLRQVLSGRHALANALAESGLADPFWRKYWR